MTLLSFPLKLVFLKIFWIDFHSSWTLSSILFSRTFYIIDSLTVALKLRLCLVYPSYDNRKRKTW